MTNEAKHTETMQSKVSSEITQLLTKAAEPGPTSPQTQTFIIPPPPPPPHTHTMNLGHPRSRKRGVWGVIAALRQERRPWSQLCSENSAPACTTYLSHGCLARDTKGNMALHSGPLQRGLPGAYTVEDG